MLVWRRQLLPLGAILLLIWYFTNIRFAGKSNWDGGMGELTDAEAESVAIEPSWNLTWEPEREPLWNRTLDFDALGFSNETGNPTGEYLVPNFVHFIMFGGKPLGFMHLICVLSVIKNQRPDRLYIHYNDNATFTGKYGETLLATPGVHEMLRLNRVEVPTEIHGQPLSEQYRYQHGSDVFRLTSALMEFGGIYLDTDCYVVKSLDDLRRYEIVIDWEEGPWDPMPLGNMVIMAHKDARFLRRWIECYRHYVPENYYYNAGNKPTEEVLWKEPHLVHRIKYEFATDFQELNKYYMERLDKRSLHSFYILHLLPRAMYYVLSNSGVTEGRVEFDETNIMNYPITFRDIAYDVYDTAGVDWPKEYPEEQPAEPEEKPVESEEVPMNLEEGT